MIFTVAASLAVATAAFTGTAFAGGASTEVSSVAKGGKGGNLYEFSTARERAVMVAGVDRIGKANPGTARMLRTLGLRLTFSAKSDGTSFVSAAPKGRYRVGMAAMVAGNGKQVGAYAQHVLDLAVMSSGGAVQRNYDAAVRKKLKRAGKPAPSVDALRAGLAADYAKMLGVRTWGVTQLNSRELRTVLNTWRESSRPAAAHASK